MQLLFTELSTQTTSTQHNHNFDHIADCHWRSMNTSDIYLAKLINFALGVLIPMTSNLSMSASWRIAKLIITKSLRK